MNNQSSISLGCVVLEHLIRKVAIWVFDLSLIKKKITEKNWAIENDSILLSFQTIYMYVKLMFPASILIKIKHWSIPKNNEDTLHFTVSNIQSRYNSSFKNKLHLSQYLSWTSYLIHGKIICTPKDCLKLKMFIIYHKNSYFFHPRMVEYLDVKPVDRKEELYTFWRSKLYNAIFLRTDFSHDL